MPTRVSRSKSYSYKLFGVRHTVRRTTSSGGARRGAGVQRSGPNVQIHLTGRDLLEMQRQHAETVQALKAEATDRHMDAMNNLSDFAVKLHTKSYAIPALVITILCTIVGLATSTPIWLVPAALFAVDWHNVTTLHGRINWPLFHYEKGSALYWTCVCCLALFPFVQAGIYLVQCLQLEPQVREAQRAKLQADIARLEQELHPELAQPTPSQSQSQSQPPQA